jgi:hypothetical protein
MLTRIKGYFAARRQKLELHLRAARAVVEAKEILRLDAAAG